MRLRRAAVAATAVLGLTVTAGCSAADVLPGGSGGSGAGGSASGDGASQDDGSLEITATPQDGAGAVPVDARPTVRVTGGELGRVTLSGPRKDLEGVVADDGGWVATDRLEPGTTYTLTAEATGEDGESGTTRTRFTTQDLTLDQQTFPSVAPLEGETVGVGMPVIVQFDVPVTDRASIERHLSVESTPAQPGSWHWISDSEVRWRPKDYWEPGTEVTVDADVNSVDAGGGIYGQESRSIDFTVGSSVINRVDIAAHTMKTFIDGDLARTMPISAGKGGFETRSGTKVIMEKFRTKTMDAATTGIQPGDPEYYNIDDVEYALRVTNSGEFLHAAPWSVGSQGSANVSHGCVGMSTEDAAWVYDNTKRGDVVEVTGSSRPMTVDNGWGDWNESFQDYSEGSALG
ncbi:Ig-like domain-containing protein [Nocardioides sp. CFH 31398]|uniref:L,D-transpeptidase n=1 Tax=Nocardioides sp. CFH 31398 TaxID=2919579 RepID=UPI001F05179C|nr:Ig-like domain-containing protein [Nocardioides sp. CFH 31398]MCH1868201.1 Ig-like domain-containing protein [Nocardioides sp. CFH 31398]